MILIIGIIFDCVIDSVIILHPNVQIELFLLSLVLACSNICDLIFDPSLFSHVPLVLIIDHVADQAQFGYLDYWHDGSAIYKPIEIVLKSLPCLVSKHKVDSLDTD